MSAHKPKPISPPSCKGWNYHVFTVCSDRCSVCGWNRYEVKR